MVHSAHPHVFVAVLTGVLVATTGCGGGDDLALSPLRPMPANPCATRGAVYTETFEELDGDCGPMAPDSIVVTDDGTVLSSMVCSGVTTAGCTATDSGCRWSSDAAEFSSTFTTVFAVDGMSAHGTATLHASRGNTSCDASYSIRLERVVSPAEPGRK
jgi:hypothetical protein